MLALRTKEASALATSPTRSFGGNAACLILNTIAYYLTPVATRLGMELGRV